MSNPKQGEKKQWNINGTLMDNQHATAHIFNKYFSIITEEIMGIKRTDRISQLNNSYSPNKMSYPCIKFSHTSTHEWGRIIKSLKPTNSQYYDEISVKVLKWSTPFNSSPWTYMHKKCYKLGIFPSRLEFSIVKPTLKTGDRLNITKCRLI
jgi:hypothetical protein